MIDEVIKGEHIFKNSLRHFEGVLLVCIISDGSTMEKVGFEPVLVFRA